MNVVTAFFKLVRWQNLVFIVLTQVLFYQCIYFPLYQVHHTQRLVFLVAASVLIAAAGYIINDYFDLNIDQVNKPQKIVVDKAIPRRWAILLHLFLSFFGIVFTALAVGFSRWYLIVANTGCVALLWFYSTSLKRRLLIGNVVISLLTAWTILVLFYALSSPRHAFNTTDSRSTTFFKFAFLYASFAFIISIIREAIKDMEDMKGDLRYGCRTLPIVTGLRTAKLYTAIWLVVLIATLIILQLYVLQLGWWHSVLYGTAFVILPLAMVLKSLRTAYRTKDFAVLSRQTKWIMLSGILSMIFFLFYF